MFETEANREALDPLRSPLRDDRSGTPIQRPRGRLTLLPADRIAAGAMTQFLLSTFGILF
jgi:hypothetical protein